MPDNQIGTAFVQIAARGLQEVQKAFDAVRQYVNNAAKGVSVPIGADTTGANASLSALRTTITAISKAVTIPISVVTRGALAGIGVLKSAITGLASTASSVAGSVAQSIQGLAPTFDKMASVARGAFLSIAAAVGTFVAAASPGDILEFKVAVAQLSVQIGSIFLPIIRSVTSALQSLLEWFRTLSPEVKAQVEWWTWLALKVSAAVVVFVSVVKVIGGIASVVAMATASLTGLGIVVAGVVAGLSALFGMGVGDFGKLGDSLTQFVAGIPELLYKVFEPIGTIALEAFNKLIEIWNQLAPFLQTIWNSVLDTIEPFIASVGELFGTVFEVLKSSFAVIATVAVQVAAVFKTIVSVLSPWISYIASILRPAFEFLGKVVTTLSDAIKFVVNTIIDAVNGLSKFISDWTGIQLGQIKRLEYSSSQAASQAKDPEKERLAKAIWAFDDFLKTMTDEEHAKRTKELDAIQDIPIDNKMKGDDPRQPRELARAKMQADVWEAEDKRIRERIKLNALPPKLQLEFLQKQLVQVEAGIPKLAPQKPEITGIAELMRKAQQATQGLSPEFAARQEQLKLIQAGNTQRAELINKIRELSEKIEKEMKLPGKMG